MKPLDYLTDNGKKIFKSILDFIFVIIDADGTTVKDLEST